MSGQQTPSIPVRCTRSSTQDRSSSLPNAGPSLPARAIVSQNVATVVSRLAYRNPGRSRHPSPRMATSAEREAGLKHEPPTLCQGDFLRQPHRRAKVPVLAHDDCGFILSLVGRSHQVQGQADIYPLLLASSVDSAPVDVDPSAPQIPDLVRPEAVPEQLRRTDCRIGDARVETNLRSGRR